MFFSLTNRNVFPGVCNTDLGTSDFHNCICVSSKMFTPSHSKHKITYRSMKHFSENAFQNDVDSIPFHVCNIFDDIDDVSWMHDKLFMSVLDRHAPIKLKLWTNRFHTWTLLWEKPLIKEICGVANILKNIMINNSEWNMLCGGIVW